MSSASYTSESDSSQTRLVLGGEWQLQDAPSGDDICASISPSTPRVVVDTSPLQRWDSSLVIAMTQLERYCTEQGIELDVSQTPRGLQQLLALAGGIPAFRPAEEPEKLHFLSRVSHFALAQWEQLRNTLIFVGDICLALGRWLTGRAKTRRSDIYFFVEQAGPRALAIVTLIALLVGMILAYLGSVQLRQLGAQVYVADLVAIGMVREMGALMTAVIMAGRTGAAYAAQLGTMQVNEEIDALKVMGISSMEFLVLPRLLALVFVMPLLAIYANVVGIIGGAIIATSMDVSIIQYVLQSQGAVDWVDVASGLIKSLFFGILIAIAGCQAGLNCGRNSNAVGMAATNAVVKAIVYLVLADAAFNVLYDKLGI
ncbi:ABC transporter permease [Cellvibrio polysaccharolyticus]|uniref:ABC transporter permease n=1 Tax=Cellvibrio polysaccharolyticus TaxID=2082724 RepID=A0A928V4V4_9GAMM|nr:ABC transporter permease [Cellvibrio polysaccharolyticus]MBE8716649.1 ABC transporter permease [Cellvibrio polysaccharolyticus]